MGTASRITAPMLVIALSAGLVTIHAPGAAVARPARSNGTDVKPGKSPVVSQQNERARPVPQEEKTDDARGPMDVFADIERGWRTRSVDPILEHFGAQKVAISVEGTGPSGGSFSRSQSYYLLKDLFRYTITRKFEFTQYRKPGDENGQSFAIAERHYQKTDDGRLIKDKVYVSLHLETDDGKERWVVDEIKSIR
jgi:hypothetical protein